MHPLAPTHMLTEHLLRGALGWFCFSTGPQFDWGGMSVDDLEGSPHPLSVTVELQK